MARILPSGLNSSAPIWPTGSTAMRWRLATSHNSTFNSALRVVMMMLLVASVRRSPLNAARRTPPVPPVSGPPPSGRPVALSHTWTVPSMSLVSSVFPSWPNATAKIASLGWMGRSLISRCRATSHSRSVR